MPTLNYDINEILDNCVGGNIIVLGNKDYTIPLFQDYNVNNLFFLDTIKQENIPWDSIDMIIVDTSDTSISNELEEEIAAMLHSGIIEKKGKKIVFPSSHHKILINSLEFILANFPSKEFYSTIQLLNEKGIPVFYFQEPTVYQVNNKSDHEQELSNLRFSFRDILSDSPEYCRNCSELMDWDSIMQNVIGNKYSDNYLEKIKTGNLSKNIYLKNGIPFYSGRSEYINFSDGVRYTTDTPESYSNYIHVIGRSTIQGLRLEDKDTLPSNLQRLVNNICPNQYKVVNHAYPSIKPSDITLILNNITYHQGDVVIIFWMNNTIVNEFFTQLNGDYLYNLQEIVNRPHNMGEVFFDILHYNAVACQAFAEHVISQLKTKGIFLKKKDDTAAITLGSNNTHKYYQDINNSPQFKKFIADVKNLSKSVNELNSVSSIGSIVMNCNPFTFGHKYLIDTALTQTDFLYIFIVEENRSEYSFEERINLVKEVYKDNPNICIIGSGNYIISKDTFPEYFDKKNLQNTPISPTNDVTIFGSCIAPALRIRKRFVGEEPLDTVTKQYNDQMKKLLPDYNVELIEIKRKEFGDTPISASYVRRLLSEWNETNTSLLRAIVPDNVYKFLINKHFGNNK